MDIARPTPVQPATTSDPDYGSALAERRLSFRRLTSGDAAVATSRESSELRRSSFAGDRQAIASPSAENDRTGTEKKLINHGIVGGDCQWPPRDYVHRGRNYCPDGRTEQEPEHQGFTVGGGDGDANGSSTRDFRFCLVNDEVLKPFMLYLLERTDYR